MNIKSSWGHKDEKKRKQNGLPIEKQFAAEFDCACGGSLCRPDHYWECDWECDTCGMKFEVKQVSERTGNIAISEKAWNGYDDDILIVTQTDGVWYGEDKQTITETCNCIHDARPSTHASTGGYNGQAYDSSYYLIPLRSLKVL